MEAGGFREESAGAVLTAALAGLGAAVLGGVAWGLIVKWSGYEIGFAAWAIGFVVGTAVAFGGQGLRGMQLQVLAVVLALAGIVLGKYLAFVWVGQGILDDVGVSLPLFSTDTVRFFWDIRTDVWGVWDLLWAGLAVVTAFRIPRRHRAEASPVVSAVDSPLAAPAEPAPVANQSGWADRMESPVDRERER